LPQGIHSKGSIIEYLTTVKHHFLTFSAI